MKTPTKEQIEQITKECLWKGGSTWTFQKIAELAIWEWEKIRDIDQRVEEMCKNNPGIKDFEDFNRKIRS